MKLKNWHKFLENLSKRTSDGVSFKDSEGIEKNPYVFAGGTQFVGRYTIALKKGYTFGRIASSAESIGTNTDYWNTSVLPIGGAIGYETSSEISEDDYTIDTTVSNQLEIDTTAYTSFTDDFIHATIAVYNTSDSDITINTIGLFCYFITENFSAGTTWTAENNPVRSALLTKDHFADITIKPNDTVIFTIKVD